MAKTSDARPVVSAQEQLAQAKAARFKATAAYKAVLDERGNRLMEANETAGPRSKSYMELQEKLKRESAQLERIASAVKRPISRWQIRPAFLILTGGLLAILEAPANKFLFDVALQSSGIVSYAVSFGVTAFLLFLAHFGGRSIRQVWSDYRNKVIVSAILVFVLCVGAGALIMSVLTVARAAFASQGGTIADLMTGITGNIQSFGPVGALVSALGDTSALVLACINLGGFVVTFVLAFFSHDSDRDFDHAQHAVDALEKKMSRVHAIYLRERAALVRKYTPDLVGFASNYDNANGLIIQIKTRLNMPLEPEDSFVLTDLDQMAEDADRQDRNDGYDSAPEPPPTSPGAESGVTSMRDYRRQSGAESA